MASVVFSTVGQAIGGPFGAGVGLAVGSSIDRSLAAGGGRRVQDGFAMRSAYGEIVPMLFGTSRTAGLLIWMREPESGGPRKGSGRRPTLTGSFAVAISAGPISEVRRIWADGREFRSADGRQALPCEIRVHSAGSSGPDPLILAQEDGVAPDFRGLSYVVFEGLALAEFGNRVPSLSFEVIADRMGPADWLSGLARTVGVTCRASGAAIGAEGYLALERDPVSELEPMGELAGAWPVIAGARLTLEASPPMHAVPLDDIVLDDEAAQLSATRDRAARPRGVSVSYLDSGRDHQLGLQEEVRARPGGLLRLERRLSGTPEAAKALAIDLLGRAEARADTLKLVLPVRWAGIEPGHLLRLGGGDTWRVIRRDISGLKLQLLAERVPVPEQAPTQADGGRGLPAPVRVVPPTALGILECPALPGVGPAALALAGGPSGWRGAELTLLDSGVETLLGWADGQKPFGRLAAPLEAGPIGIWDERNAILLTEADPVQFPSREASAVVSGAGLIAIGQELILYRDAEPLGGGGVRLSGLIRGVWGTRSAAHGPERVGQPVFGVTAAEALCVPLDGDSVGRQLLVLAEGAGDPLGGTDFTRDVTGLAVAPLPPVHLAGTRQGDGALICSWVGAHAGWLPWAANPPLLPQSFLWRHRADAGEVAEMVVDAETLTLSAALQQQRFGRTLGAGMFHVEAMGEGDPAARTSAWCRPFGG